MAIITLLSDLGAQSVTIASVKGALYTRLPEVTVVDISHEIKPFYLQEAAYLLASGFRKFPAGTVHIAVFDVFSDKAPRLVVCEKQGQYFLSPDNGLLSLALGAVENSRECMVLGQDAPFSNWLDETVRIASLVATGQIDLSILPPIDIKPVPGGLLSKLENNMMQCQIVHIDRFENVIVNVTREQFEKERNGRPFRVEFMRNEVLTTINTGYNNVPPGEKLCRFNSAGYLEISINRGNAAGLFGLSMNQEKDKIRHSIKIYFE